MTSDFLTDAVMAAAFPSHALVGELPTLIGACTDSECECKSWPAVGAATPPAAGPTTLPRSAA